MKGKFLKLKFSNGVKAKEATLLYLNAQQKIQQM